MGLDKLSPDDRLPKGYLSPSQINTYLNCPEKYRRSYIENIKSPPSVAMITGTSCHVALEGRNKEVKRKCPSSNKERQKISKVTIEEFQDTFSINMEDVEDKESENPDDNRRIVAKSIENYVVGGYHEKGIVSVEQYMEMQISGFPVMGFLDLELKTEVFDYKTSGRKKSVHDLSNDVAQAFYAYVKRKKSRFVTVHKNKEQISISEFEFGKKDFLILEETISNVGHHIIKGNFPKMNRFSGNFLCSPKYCGYYSACQLGKVK